EGDLAVDGFSGGQVEPRSVHSGGERSLGVVTGCEQSPEGEQWNHMQSAAHLVLPFARHGTTLSWRQLAEEMCRTKRGLGAALVVRFATAVVFWSDACSVGP